MSAIDSIVARWSRPDPRSNQRLFLKVMCDCKIVDSWFEALRSAGVACSTEGVMTDDPKEEPQSGYRRKDGVVVVHYWVTIGKQQLIFDPTASQFHRGGLCQLGRRLDRGGVSLDRYIVSGKPFAENR